MSLAKRLQQVTPPEPPARDLALDELRQELHHKLINELGPLLRNEQLPDATLRDRVRDELKALLDQNRSVMSTLDRDQLTQEVFDDIVGYGPIDRHIRDGAVTEIMVNGPANVFVEREGRIHRVPATFIDESHLRRIIDKIVGQVGRRVDESSPMVDARLPDGSRVNVVMHPLSIGGPFLTIRKFATDALQIEDLIRFRTLSAAAAEFLEACVRGRCNIVVSGGTGTGKTTMLNVLSAWFADDERIITIEDAKELQLRQSHVLPMEARPPNIEGKGQVTIRDLVRNALRMRPDRIVVGEVRGGEALDMLQAMNTGHDGSLTSVHSNSPRDTLARIETMALMAGLELPIHAIRDQMSSAIDLIVHTTRLRDGTRRVTNLSEVVEAVGDKPATEDLFVFDFSMGIDEHGRFKGDLKPTGRHPRFAERLRDVGVELDARLFEPAARTPKPRPRKATPAR